MELSTGGLVGIGAALVMGAAALATAWAQSAIGSSGMGVLAEKPEQFTNVLIALALPESIVILGFVLSFLMLGHIGE